MALAYSVETLGIGSYQYKNWNITTASRGTHNASSGVISSSSSSNYVYVTDLKFQQNSSLPTKTQFKRYSNGYIIQSSQLGIHYGKCRFKDKTNENEQPEIESTNTYNGVGYDVQYITVGAYASDSTVDEILSKLVSGERNVNGAGSIGYAHVSGSSLNGYYYSTSNGTYNHAYSSDLINLVVAMIPIGDCPQVTIENGRSLGVITSPDGIKVKCDKDQTLHIILDGSELGTMQVSANVSTDVPMSKYWNSISKETQHTLVLRSSSAYLTEDKTTFTKMDTGIEILGKPVTVDKRPVSCSVITSTDIPSGASMVVQACNNGNDASPAWERCDDGKPHVFENDTKTGDSWAINWKINVDAGTASTQPKIYEKVALGVLYEGE